MSLSWEVLSGTLLIRGNLCYFLGDDVSGDRIFETDPSLLQLAGLPTGAAYHEGFSAAVVYFTKLLGKHDGDRIKFWGARCSCRRHPIVVQDHRAMLPSCNGMRA